MARYCDGCGHPLEGSMQFCDKCGRRVSESVCRHCKAALEPGERFCRKCGAPVAGPSTQPPQNSRQPYAALQKKSRAGLFIGLGVAAVAVVVLAVIVVGGGALVLFSQSTATPAPTISESKTPPVSAVGLNPFPDELKVDPNVKVNCSYNAPDYIIPANYRSLDYVVFLQCSTDRDKTKLLVTVEIPEFTQKYEQMIDVSRAETELKIHPPLLESAEESLNSSRDAQIVVSVKDESSGKLVLQDTRPVKLYSFYDMKWEDVDGTPYYENILSWVTPEAPEILKMLRDSGDSASELTGGAMDAIVGYQQAVSGWSQEKVVEKQVDAMMYTLAAKYNVQYNNASFSSTSSELQRIATPASVINNHAGLCIETAVTMASAIQSTGMHAVIILLPGHAQVAVETWKDSGEYILIETTALDSARNKNFGNVEAYMTKQQWKDYLAQDGYVAIDCDLAEQLHIMPID